jgi:hypothetical protein
MYYAAKREMWAICWPIVPLALPVIALGIVFALMGDWNDVLWVIRVPLLLLILVLGLVLWTTLGTSYEITSSHVVLRAGALRQTIKLDAIVEAVPTSEPWYKVRRYYRYASSADAVRIGYQRDNKSNGEVVISPDGKSRFLADLAKAAPHLQDVGGGTLRRRSESLT